MKLKDIEVDFDFLDADDVERLEKEAKIVLKKCEEEEKKEMSIAESIRKQCEIVNIFFDNVFGEKISEKLFKGKNNLREHLELFEEIINEKKKEDTEIRRTYDRYQPNRETRRNNKYNKGRR